MLRPAAPRGERLLRTLARAWLGAVVAFALAVSALAIRDHTRVPFVDDWRVLDHTQSRELVPYLFAAENGHRLPLTLALFAIDQEWFGGRMELLVAAGLLCTALAAGLLHRAFRRDGALSEPIGAIALGFAVYALFWAASCHDLLWGLNQGSLQAVALVILALGSLARVDPARVLGSLRWLGLATLSALLATLSQGVGAASWAALVAAAAARRLPWRVVAGLAALGAIVVALFGASLPPHPRISFAGSLRYAAGNPLSLLELALAFLGSVPARVAAALGLGAPMPQVASRGAWAEHTRDLYSLAVALGGGALALFATVWVARARRPGARPALDALSVGLMAFAVAGAGLVAFARAAIVGPAAAVQLRFVTWSTLFWIGAACALVPRRGRERSGPRAWLVALLLPAASAAALPALRDARRFHATSASQAESLATALRLGLRHDELARSVSLHDAELVHRVAARLEAQGRWPFDEARRGLRATALRDRFADGGACRGELVRLGVLRLAGGEAGRVWGWLSPPAGGAPPRFVVLADEAGVIRGLADFAAAPPRVRPVEVPGEERLAWAGFIADYDPSQRYSAYAVLADGAACRLGSA